MADGYRILVTGCGGDCGMSECEAYDIDQGPTRSRSKTTGSRPARAQ